MIGVLSILSQLLLVYKMICTRQITAEEAEVVLTRLEQKGNQLPEDEQAVLLKYVELLANDFDTLVK